MSGRQAWNSGKSMIKAPDLLQQCAVKSLGTVGTKRAEYVIPTVQKGAEAASAAPTVYADGTQLPICVVVAGSGCGCHTSTSPARTAPRTVCH